MVNLLLCHSQPLLLVQVEMDACKSYQINSPDRLQAYKYKLRQSPDLGYSKVKEISIIEK
jgi:hypothetical protein